MSEDHMSENQNKTLPPVSEEELFVWMAAPWSESSQLKASLEKRGHCVFCQIK